MRNTVKFTTFLILLSFLHQCYSTSRPRPDDATVIVTFGLGVDEKEFQEKAQEFSQKLKEAYPRIQFEEGNTVNLNLGRAKLYKAKLTYNLPNQVRTIGSSLGIKRVSVVPQSIGIVTVEYKFSSDEYYFHQKLKEADIQVIRKEEWLRAGFRFYESKEFPHDQEYIVAASLKSEVEQIAESEGILKRIYK